jgi:hypothetical protein
MSPRMKKAKPARVGLTTPEARVLWHLAELPNAVLEAVRDAAAYPPRMRYTLLYGEADRQRSLVFEEGVLVTLVNRKLLEPYDQDYTTVRWRLRLTSEGTRELARHREHSTAGRPRDLAH